MALLAAVATVEPEAATVEATVEAVAEAVLAKPEAAGAKAARAHHTLPNWDSVHCLMPPALPGCCGW